MDNSLSQILEIANDTHSRIFKDKVSITVNDYINSVHKLKAYVDHLRSVANRVEEIHNNCLKEVHNKLQNIKNEGLSVNQMERIGTSEWNSNITSKTEKDGDCEVHGLQEVVPGIKTMAIHVDDISEIPNSELYWAKNIQQFAIRINNILIRGNIGNISTDRIGKSKIINVIKCQPTLQNFHTIFCMVRLSAPVYLVNTS